MSELIEAVLMTALHVTHRGLGQIEHRMNVRLERRFPLLVADFADVLEGCLVCSIAYFALQLAGSAKPETVNLTRRSPKKSVRVRLTVASQS
jgi:hypothetical protein